MCILVIEQRGTEKREGGNEHKEKQQSLLEKSQKKKNVNAKNGKPPRRGAPPNPAKNQNSLKKEIINIKDLFALRSDSISSELGMRIDDLKVTTDLSNEKRKKESDIIEMYERELYENK